MHLNLVRTKFFKKIEKLLGYFSGQIKQAKGMNSKKTIQ